jgi:hypothetical protein
VGGPEIHDQVIFSISRQRFDEDIGSETGMTRPQEGDIIYYPLNKKNYVIRYVDQYEMHYPLGKIYTWKMTCETFEYSNEKFITGIPEIDAIQTRGSINILDYTIRDTDGVPLMTVEGDYLVTDAYKMSKIVPLDDTFNITDETIANNLIDWTDVNPFGDWADQSNKEI